MRRSARALRGGRKRAMGSEWERGGGGDGVGSHERAKGIERPVGGSPTNMAQVMWPARPSYHLVICMCSHRSLSAGQNSGAAFNVAISTTSDASQDLGPSMHSSHFPCHQRQERHCGFRASEWFSIGQNVDS